MAHFSLSLLRCVLLSSTGRFDDKLSYRAVIRILIAPSLAVVSQLSDLIPLLMLIMISVRVFSIFQDRGLVFPFPPFQTHP